MPSKTGRIHYHILSYLILYYIILFYFILYYIILYYITYIYINIYIYICYPINISKYSLMMPQKYSIENESRDPQDPTVTLTLADALHGDSYDSVLAERAAWLQPEKYGHWRIVWRCFWVFQGLLAKKQQAEVGLELLFDDFSGGVSVLLEKQMAEVWEIPCPSGKDQFQWQSKSEWYYRRDRAKNMGMYWVCFHF